MSTHNGNNNSIQPYSQRDYIRQEIEQSLAALISDWEAEYKVAIHEVEIERDNRNERGRYNDLSCYPGLDKPHAPIARVRITIAEGPLVSATMRPVEEEPEPESTEPPETIEEAELRLARQAFEDEDQGLDMEMEIASISEPELVKTHQEAHSYGGRYA